MLTYCFVLSNSVVRHQNDLVVWQEEDLPGCELPVIQRPEKDIGEYTLIVNSWTVQFLKVTSRSG